jgi:hypothetical protein
MLTALIALGPFTNIKASIASSSDDKVGLVRGGLGRTTLNPWTINSKLEIL